MNEVNNNEETDLSPRLKKLQAELLEHEQNKSQINQEQKQSSKPTLYFLLSGIIICLIIFFLLNYLYGFETLIDRTDNLFKGFTFIALLPGIPFLLISFFIGRRIGNNLIKEKKRSSIVSGLIVTNYIEEGWEEAGKMYRPVISYQFDIDNNSYTNTSKPWKHWHTNWKRTNKVFEEYKTGKIINVYYDPDDIQNSGIKQTKRLKYYLIILTYIISCILTSTGIYLFLRLIM